MSTDIPVLTPPPNPAKPPARAAGPGRAGWQDKARCATADPDLFFPGKGERSAPARRICAACPVRAQCLTFAVDNDIEHGVWGGQSETQRRNLVRQRNARRVRELAAAS